MGLSFDFLGFVYITIKLESGFQNNNLSSFNLGLSLFGYRGNFFLNHAISLRFCGVSKLRWLDKLFFIIPFNRGKGKLESCENKLES